MKQIPNALTIFRLLLVPLIWKLLWGREYEKVILVGFVAGVSDVLDGAIARRLGATSKFGAYLDPLADKLMLSGAYLIFLLDRVTPAWLPRIVIGRDVMILLFAAYAYFFTPIREFPPSRWGKLSTLIQLLTAFVILFNRSILMDVSTYRLENWMVWLCGAITLFSGVHYAWLGVQALRQKQ
jgi:cardiolipin synthase (CMP-forming)